MYLRILDYLVYFVNTLEGKNETCTRKTSNRCFKGADKRLKLFFYKVTLYEVIIYIY